LKVELHLPLKVLEPRNSRQRIILPIHLARTLLNNLKERRKNEFNS
jgi:hypothetical protein